MKQSFTRSYNHVHDQMEKLKTVTIAFLVLLSIFLAVGCESDKVPSDAPEGHTTMKDGVAHKPGLGNPATNCVACHGASLDGGEDGEPSCFSCHGRKW